MKKFIHLYENVLNWNDSAGRDAFSDAKRRFWAEINGLPCDISLPDPDLYIDSIDWDSRIDPEQLLDPIVITEDEDHDPVVIFGDSLLPNETYSQAGWGDDEDNFKVPANSSSANHGAAPWEQNWGDSFENGAPNGWSGYPSNNAWGDEKDNFEVPVNSSSANNHAASWEQKWGDSFGNGAPVGWAGYPSDAWHYGDGSGYMTWGGGWENDWGWNCAGNNINYEVGPDSEHNIAAGEKGPWKDGNLMRVNVGGHMSSDRSSRIQGKDYDKNHISRNHHGPQKATYWGKQSSTEKRHDSGEWNSFNSCGPLSRNAGITVGQRWNR